MPSPRPRIDIPGAWTPYDFEADPPNEATSHYEQYLTPTAPPTAHAVRPELPNRPHTVSVFEPDTAQIAFPEPQLNRSVSSRAYLHAPHSISHRSSRSDVSLNTIGSIYRPPSTANLSSQDLGNFSDDLSSVPLDAEGIRLFQENRLMEAQEQWHCLVPEEAREVLDKQEVQRQSVLFEVFKSEKDYVFDLDLVREVFVIPLLTAVPPVMPPDCIQDFISEVFWNLESIAGHHQRMLAILFARQREQHPLVQSVADVILEACLLFRQDYESYIKHYPLAEARHRKELRKNGGYQEFIQKCSHDSRIRKRDLITFLSRPVTRLPRLALVLEHTLKLTQPEHPDLENLPLILSIFNDFVKSTQPGIEAAEGKVKFWNLCENLVYMKEEIIEMDMYDESRTLIYANQLGRHSRSEVGHGWLDLYVVLLDNYLLLTKEEKHNNGVLKYHLISRPTPLEYLRLGDFDSPAENRKEKPDDRGILDSLRSHYRPVFPFTVYHASAKSTRGYTLYANTEAARKKWKDLLLDTLTVRRVRQEGNMFFAPHDIDNGTFRFSTNNISASIAHKTKGKITTACQMISRGKRFMIVGCASGIYVGLRGQSSFKKALPLSNATSIYILQDYNKVVIHHGSDIAVYSLDLLARFALDNSSRESLNATYEKVAGNDGAVMFCRVGQVGKRTILIYASKTFLQVTVYALEAVNIGEISAISTRRTGGSSISFRSFGDPFSIPKDAFDVTTLTRTIGICTDKGIIITDPTNFTRGSFTVVPDFTNPSDPLPMSHLKARCESAKPLGLVRCENSELLLIYDELGCYITRHGRPSHSYGYIRWETKATSYAAVDSRILLFSSNFIEIRAVASGKLLQVIEGQDIRLLYTGFAPNDKTVLVGMKGDKDDGEGASYKLVDLVETQEIQPESANSMTLVDGAWDTWDM